jgi:hypothetical protein
MLDNTDVRCYKGRWIPLFTVSCSFTVGGSDTVGAILSNPCSDRQRETDDMGSYLEDSNKDAKK